MKFKITQMSGHSETLEIGPLEQHVLMEKFWNEYCKAQDAEKPTALAYGQGHKLLCALFNGRIEILPAVKP